MTSARLRRGSVTKKGYRRMWVGGQRRLRMEHVVVWEAAHGEVPPGHDIHHINGDKLDNRIENLRCLTRLEHKRIHSGCQLRDGVWWKPCRTCRAFKPVPTDFYVYAGRGRSGAASSCKKCCSRQAVEYKRKRKERLRAMRLASPLLVVTMSENAPAVAEAKEAA